MTGTAIRLVVADAGPLIGLARIDRLDLLHQLFGRVSIPDAVAAELCLDGPLPGARALGIAVGQKWLQIVPVTEVLRSLLTVVDRGEAEAITLAKLKNARLLIDETIGRRAAQRAGVRVFGTGAVLVRAKETGAITEVRRELDALMAAGYRISVRLRDAILMMAGEHPDRYSKVSK